jgi:hypothetical protein
MIQEAFQVMGKTGQGRFGDRIRTAVARSVHRDQAYARRRGCFRIWAKNPGARAGMEEHKRRTPRIPPFRPGQQPTVREGEDLVGVGGCHRISSSTRPLALRSILAWSIRKVSQTIPIAVVPVSGEISCDPGS